MGPNQNMAGENSLNATPVAEQNINDKKRGGNGMIIGMILAIILAVGGVGFGVWAMMDGNSQKAQLNQQIGTLKKQNSELAERISTLEEGIEQSSNPDEHGDMIEYLEMNDLGIKIKKSDDFPDMVVKKNENSSLGAYIIKRESGVPDNSPAPDAVTWMKSSTCDSEELTLGYGAKIEIGGSCYLMSEIAPYGVNPEYPLTEFLEYVMDEENYSLI